VLRSTQKPAESDSAGKILPKIKRKVASGDETRETQTEGTSMLWTIFVILLVAWLLGIVSGVTLGNFIHILLVIALVVLIINLIQGRRPL
jgi:hypothetical protein